MFAKLLTLILAICVVYGVLLDLRHRRLYLMHDMTRMHRQMDQDRKNIWDHQVHIAYQFVPDRLRENLTQHKLPMVPRAIRDEVMINVSLDEPPDP